MSIGGLSHPSASYCLTSTPSSVATLDRLGRWFCGDRRMMSRVVGKCCCLNLLCSNYNDFVSSKTMEMFHTRTTSWTPIYDDLLDFACGSGKWDVSGRKRRTCGAALGNNGASPAGIPICAPGQAIRRALHKSTRFMT